MNHKRYTYADGAVYEGEWRGKLRDGQGNWTRPDGTRYYGEWKNDKPEGWGILVKPDGSRHAGLWRAGKRHGSGIYTAADGIKLSGIWSGGSLVERGELNADQVKKCQTLEQELQRLTGRVAELELKKSEKRAGHISLAYLRKFNFTMGFLHLIQGAAMLVLALSIDQFKAFKTPVWTYFLEFNQDLMRLVTRPEQIWEVPFAIFVSLFLFLSAIAHIIIVTPLANEKYNRDLKKGINIFRWYEYSLSSSLMIVLIALLFGVYDLGALIAIFILNASMNWFGLLMEKINQYSEKTIWSPFVYGTVAGLGPWVVIIIHALGNANPAEVPWFVYAIIGSYFIFFNLFPVNMILQYKKVGKWADYLYGERTYIVLSLFAKSILAWLVFAGVMQPV